MSDPTTEAPNFEAPSEMVEQVAMAMRLYERKAQPVEFYCSLARVAIAAMREPSRDQHAAFAKTLNWMSDTPLGDQQRQAWREENTRRWQLMIDAALGEESP